MTKNYHSIRDSKGQFAKAEDIKPRLPGFSASTSAILIILGAACVLGSTYIVLDLVFGRAL